MSTCKELLRVLARSLNTGDKEDGETGANTQHLQVRDIETDKENFDCNDVFVDEGCGTVPAGQPDLPPGHAC